MKIKNVEGCDIDVEPPRSTAYYYADLERIKGKQDGGNTQNGINTQNGVKIQNGHCPQNRQDGSHLPNEVKHNGTVQNTQDRPSPGHASRTPGETYSTAGTFPMPQPKEKEPLLAELEVVGRLPLHQLETSPSRSSRSWYLCCPNNDDEEISRESSWRYASLRPVTSPPTSGQNGLIMVASADSTNSQLAAIKAERDSLARALSTERARAAAAARAAEARLAELHAVLAELARRRRDESARAIPEEDASDDCESSIQQVGGRPCETDCSLTPTHQNDTSSITSPVELQVSESKTHGEDSSSECPKVEIYEDSDAECLEPPTLRDDSRLCLTTARWCQSSRGGSVASCERQRGSPLMCPASPGRCEARQARLASRVRLRPPTLPEAPKQIVSAESTERLVQTVCEQADLREAMVASNEEGVSLDAGRWRTRARRLEAELRVTRAQLANTAHTAYRLSCACASLESCAVCAGGALRAADRALEAYDVLLALAETRDLDADSEQRMTCERVARRLLRRLDVERVGASPPATLLPPGPWLTGDLEGEKAGAGIAGWCGEREKRLRAHAARLKRETVALRALHPLNTPPGFFSYHDIDMDDVPKGLDTVSTEDLEAAIALQEELEALETEEAKAPRTEDSTEEKQAHEKIRIEKKDKGSMQKNAVSSRRHWLETTSPTSNDITDPIA